MTARRRAQARAPIGALRMLRTSLRTTCARPAHGLRMACARLRTIQPAHDLRTTDRFCARMVGEDLSQ
jgi:hypothetical protein